MSIPITIFFSYAHEDYQLCQKVNNALAVLKRKELITTWLDSKIEPGDRWELLIEEHLQAADIILLLVSPDFLASDFCMTKEVRFAMDRASSQHVKVVPIILRPSGFWAEEEFGQLQALPDEGKPITMWENEDQAIEDVVIGIRKVVQQLNLAGSHNIPHTKSSLTEKRYEVRQLPSIWKIPFRQNRNFVGRMDLIEEIEESWKKGESTQALVGLGGVGKTQIAVGYVYRRAANYEAVWWLDSQDPHALAAGFMAFARELKLFKAEVAEQGLIVQAALQWLETHTKWLLIFDNAQTAEELDAWIPKMINGHILITSRNPAFRKLASCINVPELEHDDAMELLLRRSGQDDREMASQLIKKLGSLPLALEQAGASIEQTGVTIGGYLDLFEKRAAILLTNGQPLAYQATVDTTWFLSFEELRKQSPLAEEMLNLCAFCGAAPIPLELFLALMNRRVHEEALQFQLKKNVDREYILNAPLTALRRFSLVEVKDNALIVNLFIQTVLKNRLSPTEQKQWAQCAISAIQASFAFEEDEPSSWNVCGQLLPHLLTSASHAEELGVAQDVLGPLLNKTGAYLRRRAQFEEAKIILERSRILIEARYGKEHEEAAKVFNNLGRCYRDCGKIHEARDFFQQALTILDNLSGVDPLLITDVLDNLGVVLERLDQTGEAAEYFHRALVIHEALPSPDKSKWATCLNNSGLVLQKLGKLVEARSRYEDALKKYESVHGPDHPNIAFNLDKLAGVLQEIQEIEGGYSLGNEALAHYERAITILETHFGPDHPQLGNLSNNCGNHLRKMGRFQEAREYLDRALTINTKALGSDNPLVAMTLTNYGLLLRDEREKDKALSLLKQAYDVFHSHWGEESTTTKKVKKYIRELADS